MFALHRARPRTHSIRLSSATFALRKPVPRRFFVQSVCNGFLDLAIALPLPPSLPPYSSAIILVTIVSRFALLPISIWGHRRMQKVEDIVEPEIRTLAPVLAKRIFNDMQNAKIRGDKDFLRKYHAKELAKQLTIRRDELLTEHRCRPMPSTLLPPLSQLPVFMGLTILFNRLSLDPTPFDSEGFLTLTSLAHPDPTMALPVVLGFITMANVESKNWLMTAAEREQQRKFENTRHAVNLIKPILRGLSVIRIVVAAITPGSVALYWVSSATFGLIQTWIFDFIDMRRRKRRLALEPSKGPEIRTEASSPITKTSMSKSSIRQ